MGGVDQMEGGSVIATCENQACAISSLITFQKLTTFQRVSGPVSRKILEDFFWKQFRVILRSSGFREFQDLVRLIRQKRKKTGFVFRVSCFRFGVWGSGF